MNVQASQTKILTTWTVSLHYAQLTLQSLSNL